MLIIGKQKQQAKKTDLMPKKCFILCCIVVRQKPIYGKADQ